PDDAGVTVVGGRQLTARKRRTERRVKLSALNGFRDIQARTATEMTGSASMKPNKRRVGRNPLARAITSAAPATCHHIANQRQSFATAVAHERMLSTVATTHRTQPNA